MKYSNMYRRLTLPLLLFTVVGLLLVGSACEQTQTSIAPTSQTVTPGQTFTVDIRIRIEPEVAIAGAQFDLSFDPSLVTAISVAEGNLLNQGGCDTFFLPGTIDNVAGTISGVVCVIVEPGSTVSGRGILATVTFNAGETAGTSPLHLSNVVLGDKEGQTVAKQVNDGSVTVGNP